MSDKAIERALLRVDADVRERLLIFDGGPTLMGWVDAHRHHKDEPYIGCVLCYDEFVPKANYLTAVEALREALELADEGWGYANGYFRNKWGFVSRYAALIKVLHDLGEPADIDTKRLNEGESK